MAGLLTLVCVWMGTRAWLGAETALVVTTLLALHPQFTLVSTAANPDSWAILGAAVVWWQALALVSAPATLPRIVLLWAGALGAFLMRRLGAPLLVVAAVLTIPSMPGAWRTMSRRTVGAAALASIVVAIVAVPSAGELGRGLDWIRFDFVVAASTVLANAGDLPRHLWAMFTSFWVYFGWLNHPAPLWWYVVIAAIAVTAVGGLLLGRHGAPRGVLWLAAGTVAIQVAAVIAYHFGIMQAGLQGKYLFPALPAVLCLLWFGWRSALAGSFLRPWAAASLIGAMAVLNVLAWTFVILPAYA